MNVQEQTNFSRIEEAIDYIKNNYTSQPTLDEIAAHVNLSSFHFQKMFTEWAGVSPKKFVQYITVTHAKSMLRKTQATLFDTAIDTGLSSTSRLHDLFINIEGMTPAEYKNGGEHLQIAFSFAQTIFGNIIVAATQKGICYIAFYDELQRAIDHLKKSFPKAMYSQREIPLFEDVRSIFSNRFSSAHKLNLHLKGTDFQLKVWETLLTIPEGKLTTYGSIAQKIENLKASRAVGSAIGDNPVAFLIPCHRVIQSSGIFGQYMWGAKRKTAIIGWEASRTYNEVLTND
jgi:AraC family transcriptional regulator, regulatory protein of adaptative response / methylated-DNA-[protein]-cysteine methyltransferase